MNHWLTCIGETAFPETNLLGDFLHTTLMHVHSLLSNLVKDTLLTKQIYVQSQD